MTVASQMKGRFMTPEQSSTDKIRAAARKLLETCDNREAITDGTVERIECDAIFKAAVDNLVAVVDEYGLYFSLPLLLQVEIEYRNQNPHTHIPEDAFGTLIGYYECDGDEVERPLNESRRWQHAVAITTIPQKLAKCIREMPNRMVVRIRYHSDAQINGSGCETLLDELIEALASDKFDWADPITEAITKHAFESSNATEGTISDEAFLRQLEEM